MTSKAVTICFPFVGDTLGGSHISALTLVRNLDRKRFRPLVVVHEEGPLSRHLDALGIDYKLLPLRRYVGRDRSLFGHLAAMIATLPRLLHIMKCEEVALVHTNDARMHLTWTLPARLAGRAAVWHQRNVFSPSRLTALMLRLASRIIAISQFVAEHLPQTAAAKAIIIDNPFERPEGLDNAACRGSLRRELAVPAETPVVGLFGNLIDWKRPLLFVEAASLLPNDLAPPPVFAVFGEDRGGFRQQMEARAAAAGMTNRLCFMGFRQPVWPWLAGCDLILAPAINEPFGRSLVEAMLCGVAVVASDSGGHREIVRNGETGLLVPAGDAEAHAAAIAMLLRDRPLHQRLAQHGRDTVLRRFGVDQHVSRVAELYDSLLAAA